MASRLKRNLIYKTCDKEGQYAFLKKIGNNYVDIRIFKWLGTPNIICTIMHKYAINLKYVDLPPLRV